VAAAAVQYGRHGALCGDTYSTLFSLLACTGLRVSEATALRYADITADGLVIRQTKFKKARLVPLHTTARTGIEQYIERRRPYAPFDDHLFISRRRKPLDLEDVDNAFKAAVTRIGLPSCGRPRPTPHSLRHFFAVQSLLACPDGRDRITQHMVALSTVLGHSRVENTFAMPLERDTPASDCRARCSIVRASWNAQQSREHSGSSAKNPHTVRQVPATTDISNCLVRHALLKSDPRPGNASSQARKIGRESNTGKASKATALIWDHPEVWRELVGDWFDRPQLARHLPDTVNSRCRPG
jgi:integrase-like protein